jgi:hypothetical protein
MGSKAAQAAGNETQVPWCAGVTPHFARTAVKCRRDLVLWLFLNIFLKFGSVVAARLVRGAGEFRGKVAKRVALNIKLRWWLFKDRVLQVLFYYIFD